MPNAPVPDGDALAEQQLRQTLRARGQRVTSQRLVIGRLVREADRHVTAEEVLRLCDARLPGISLPTVYATLDLFAELGLVRRVSVGGPALYEPRTEEHAHMRCRTCGRVQDLPLTLDATPVLAGARAAGFRPEVAELVVEGRCAACAD